MAKHHISSTLADRIRHTAETMVGNGDFVTASSIARTLGISTRSAATGLRMANLQGRRGRPRNTDQDPNHVRKTLANETAARAAEERQGRGQRLSNVALLRNCRQAYTVGSEIAVWDRDRMGEVVRPADLPNTLRLTPGLRRPSKK